MELSALDLLNELLEYYDLDNIKQNTLLHDDTIDLIRSGDIIESPELLLFFNTHVNMHAKFIDISKLQEYESETVIIDTPDDWNTVSRFFIKKKRKCYQLITGEFKVRCSYDTLVETTSGWILCEDLKINDVIITRNGPRSLVQKLDIGICDTYDLEVDHINHKYWGGTGVSLHNTGKTFVFLNVLRESQKMGYFAYYIDTEGATEDSDFGKFGANYDQLKIIRTIKTFGQLRFFVNTLIDLKSKPGYEELKIILFVDSYGMLNTNKEVEDAKKGKQASDMGLRAKEGRQLFRNITLDLSNLSIPMLFSNHTGASLDMFKPGDIPVGGEGPTFSASIILMLDKGRLKAKDDISGSVASDDSAETTTGIIVKIKTHKNRLAQPIPAQTHISFAKGMNPYVYLETFLGWNNCGVVRGTIYTDEEFKKKFKKGVAVNSSGKELVTHMYEKDKKTYYCVEHDSSRYYAVKDTCANVPLMRLWTEDVFTHNTLLQMDENVIKPRYRYKSIDEVMADELIELAVAAELNGGEIDETILFDLHKDKLETEIEK